MNLKEALKRQDEIYQQAQAETAKRRRVEAEYQRWLYDDYEPYEAAKTEAEYWATMITGDGDDD